MRFRHLTFVAAAALILTGCASADTETNGGDNPSESLEPIKVGAVSSITGPVPFGEIPAAAGAVFDRVNAEGGINGRMIEFISEDDGSDPAVASQAARRLVEEEGVVALAGSSSMVECSVNATLYASADVLSLTGAGVEPTCFESSHIVPVNAGSLTSYEMLLTFAAEQLEAETICAVIQKVPSLTETYLELIDRWQEETGHTVALVDTTVTHGEDPTPAILEVKAAGCDAVAFNSNEPVAAAVMNAAALQGVLENVSWLTLSAAYTETALDVFTQQDTLGLYAGAEFLPFMSDDPLLDPWRDALTASNVPLTSLSQGGYVAAEILVDVLRSIDGDITRESVKQAFLDAGPIEHPLMGSPFVYVEQDAHNPNRANMMVQATETGWVTVGDWVSLP